MEACASLATARAVCIASSACAWADAACWYACEVPAGGLDALLCSPADPAAARSLSASASHPSCTAHPMAVQASSAASRRASSLARLSCTCFCAAVTRLRSWATALASDDRAMSSTLSPTAREPSVRAAADAPGDATMVCSTSSSAGGAEGGATCPCRATAASLDTSLSKAAALVSAPCNATSGSCGDFPRRCCFSSTNRLSSARARPAASSLTLLSSASPAAAELCAAFSAASLSSSFACSCAWASSALDFARSNSPAASATRSSARRLAFAEASSASATRRVAARSSASSARERCSAWDRRSAGSAPTATRHI